MIANSDKLLLQETYRNSHVAVNTINAIIDKVEDDDLSHDLNKQVAKYMEIQQKAASELNSCGESAEGISKVENALLRTSAKTNAMLDNTTSHIADMMIKGSVSGIRDLEKIIDQNKEAEDKSVKIAKELINSEKHTIDVMKSYL